MILKVGDIVKIENDSLKEDVRIVRFQANQGTVLVEMKCGKLAYFSYESLSEKC